MNLDAIRARAAEIVASGSPPVCRRYRSAYEWKVGTLEDLDARFRADYRKTDLLAAEITSRGVAVVGVLYEGKPFREWLGDDRADSREMRLQWARERITPSGPRFWSFTLGEPAAIEPAHPEARAT